MDKVLWTLVLFFVRVNAQTISTTPSDVTARHGENATLTCRVTGGEPDNINTLEWREYISNSAGYMIYKSNFGVDPELVHKYEVVGTGGNYDLKIKNSVTSDGGFYGCALALDGGAPHKGDVAVLEQPTLTYNALIEGKYNFVRCYAYYGAPAETEIRPEHRAKLRIFIEYDSGRELQEGNFTEVTKGVPGNGDDYVPWELQFDMNRTFTGSDNGVNITCEIYTDEPYVVNEVSQELDILYAVRNLEIAPQNTYYYVGEYINCTAQGNPEPEVQWEALESADQMQGFNRWRCNARNTAEQTEVIFEDYEFQVVLPTQGGSRLRASQCTLALLTALMTIWICVLSTMHT